MESFKLRFLAGAPPKAESAQPQTVLPPPRRPLVAVAIGIWVAVCVMAGWHGQAVPELFVAMMGAIVAPTFIAGYRCHRNRLAIFVMGLAITSMLMGASSFGVVLFVPALFVSAIIWLISLIWSCTNNCE
jgi:uncharacterized RDD family membrane protein YckC